MSSLLWTIIYIVGLLLAIWCVIDIFKKGSLGIIGKILLSILMLAFSWIGLLVYYFILRNMIK